MKTRRISGERFGRRALALVLALCMLWGLVPLETSGREHTARAAGESGDLIYNFLKISEYHTPGHQWSDYRETGYKIEEITDLAMTTPGEDGEIYPTSSIATAPWCLVQNTAASVKSPHYQYGAMIDLTPTAEEQAPLIQLKIYANAGYYNAATRNTKNYYAGVADVYLAPADAADPLAEKYKLGTIDPSVSWSECPSNGSGANAGNWSAGEFPLGGYTIPEDGEYLLTYRYARAGRNNLSSRFMALRVLYCASCKSPPRA